MPEEQFHQTADSLAEKIKDTLMKTEANSFGTERVASSRRSNGVADLQH